MKIKINKRQIIGLCIASIMFALVFFFIDGCTITGLLHGFILWAGGLVFIVVFFMLLSVLFAKRIIASKEAKIKEAMEQDSSLIFIGTASCIKGLSVSTGCMRLSGSALFYKPFNRDELYIPIDNIARVEKAYAVFVNPTGMVIVTTDGRKLKFSMNDRDIWIEKITEAMKKSQVPPVAL